MTLKFDDALVGEQPPLEELPHLRRLSSLELPQASQRASVMQRLKHTGYALVASQPSTRGLDVARPRSSRRAPGWLVATAAWVAVSSALAAPPVRARLAKIIDQAMPWFSRVNGRAEIERSAPRGQLKRLDTAPSALSSAPESPPDAVSAGVAESQRPLGNEHDDVVLRNTSQPALAARGVSAAPAVAEGTLPAERRLLQAARVELAANDWHGALIWVKSYRTQFPHGVLDKECDSIERQAQALRQDLATTPNKD